MKSTIDATTQKAASIFQSFQADWTSCRGDYLLARQNIDTLTSLRFFAAAMIVIGHSAGFFEIPSGWAYEFPHYHGVSFFFVLSGFILTTVYPSLPDHRSRLTFLRARFARVWPLHAFAFLLMFLTIDWVRIYLTLPKGFFTALLNLSLLQAWVPITSYNMSFNSVSWSISVEFFFYVSFIWLIRLRDSRWYLLPIIGIIPALALAALARSMHAPRFSLDYQGITIDSLLYVNPAARLFEFTLGMATACLYSKYKSAQIGYRMGTLLELFGVGLFAASLSLNANFFENGFLSKLFPSSLCVWLERCGVSPLFAAIILIFAFQKGAVSLILRQASYVRAGEISYALYILHPVILSWVTKNVAAPSSVAYATYLGLALWVSYLSWRYIEGPARAWITKERARSVPGPDTPRLASEAYQPLSRLRALWYRNQRRI